MNYTQTPEQLDIDASEFVGRVDDICLVQTNLVGFDINGQPTEQYNYKFTCFVTKKGADVRQFVVFEFEQQNPIEPCSWPDACREYLMPFLKKNKDYLI